MEWDTAVMLALLAFGVYAWWIEREHQRDEELFEQTRRKYGVDGHTPQYYDHP